MAFRRQYIILIFIFIIGVGYAFLFLSWATSIAYLSHPNWDMISFVPGNADIDNLYLIFATIPLTLVALVLGIWGARFFMFINRIGMRGREQSIESMELEMPLAQLMTRAIVPALFSFSIAAVFLQYMNQFSVEFFRPIFIPPTSIENQFRPFLANALLQSLLFLPITLTIFVPTWILNDFMVISRLKGTKPGEFSDPVKVGQWVSGLLGGFSVFAFPFTFVSTFLFDPSETGVGWVLLANRIDEIFIALVSILIILLAFVLPVIILYDANKRRIARSFFKVADKLEMDYSNVDTSSLAEDEPDSGAGFSGASELSASAAGSSGAGFSGASKLSASAASSSGAGFSGASKLSASAAGSTDAGASAEDDSEDQGETDDSESNE